ncbi:DUF4230 domain-containing protein [Pseudonocardia sp.]|uniref:DUF4230 domain-containing protein n=1 Tax=Pseudonocardia sp. TaxID=60912 RepID=UPI003D1214F0
MPRRLRAAALLLGAALLGALLLVPGIIGDGPVPPRSSDDSGPVLLHSIRDLQRIVPAQGTYEVTVLLREGRENVPTWVYGYEGALLAHGTVDAYVDLAGLGPEAVAVSADRSAVTVTLPEPLLAPPAVDHGRSQVVDDDRGLVTAAMEAFDGRSDRTQQLFRMAESKLAAAAEASELRARAERNVVDMVRGMGRGLGFDTVDVVFVRPDEP